MQLSVHHLLPIPLRDRLHERASGIWKQKLSWDREVLIFVQAPSGTGKTTLIHYLYGLRNDYEGSVKWDNSVITGPEAIATLRSGPVSVIFQDLRLFPELTARENLEIKRAQSSTVTAEEMESWSRELRIDHKMDALAGKLSYGEQQRVAIIRALLQPFQWLLMDEPFSHLDQENTSLAAALILKVVRRNRASLLIADLDDNQYFPYTQKLIL